MFGSTFSKVEKVEKVELLMSVKTFIKPTYKLYW